MRVEVPLLWANRQMTLLSQHRLRTACTERTSWNAYWCFFLPMGALLLATHSSICLSGATHAMLCFECVHELLEHVRAQGSCC